MTKIILILLFTFSGLILKAQQINLDSLNQVWLDESQADTNRFEAMKTLVWEGFLYSKPDTAFKLGQQLFELAQKKENKKWESASIDIQAVSLYLRGNNTEALKYFLRSLKIKEELGDKKGIAASLNNIGNIYNNQGKYKEALEHYQRSLKIKEELGDKKGIASSLSNIGSIYTNQGKDKEALEYFQRSLSIEEEFEDKKGMAGSLNNIGGIYNNQGKYKTALEFYQRSLAIEEEFGNKKRVAYYLSNIGGIYDKQGKFITALEYYQHSLTIEEKIGDKKGIAYSLSSIGSIYDKQGKDKEALEYFQRSLTIREEIGDKRGIAHSINNIGNIYTNQGKDKEALEYYQRGLEIREEIGDKRGIATSLKNIGNIYKVQGKNKEALVVAKKSLDIAQEIGSPIVIQGASQLLSELYEKQGQGMKALEMHKLYLQMSDSLQSIETVEKLQQMEFDKQMFQDSIANAEADRLVNEAHQEEVRQKNQTRNILFGVGGLLLLLAGVVYNRLRYVRKSRSRLWVEKDRSEKLLLNILPKEIAQELKDKGKAAARDFDTVSILFTDFKGFTEQSARLSAADLVDEINICFGAFDGIIEKFSIEKIKTIGDAYMAAGGLPIPTDDSIKNTVLAALEMQAFISKRQLEMDAKGKPFFEMRVGIHTGPVVAGIVGVKKFQYDIWGDAVNTASRMESNGEVGQVNISQTTYELLKDDPDFSFESRGKIEAKGKGEMVMWFVSKN